VCTYTYTHTCTSSPVIATSVPAMRFDHLPSYSCYEFEVNGLPLARI
jgi:hypothetical protein